MQQRGRRIARNTLWLVGLQYSTMLMQMVLVVFAARWLGTEYFGQYTTAMTFILLAGTIAQFGLLRLLIRNVAQEPHRAGEYLTCALALLSGFSLGCWALIAWSTRLLRYPPAIQYLVLLAGAMLPMAVPAQAAGVIFRARERMGAPSAVRGITMFLTVSSGVIVLQRDLGLAALVLVQVAGAALESAILWVMLRRLMPDVQLGWNRSLFAPLLVSTWPIACFEIGYMILNRADLLMVTAFVGASAAGLYGAAVRVMIVLRAPLASFQQALFPQMAAAATGSRDDMMTLYHRATAVTLLWAAPLTVCIVMCAEGVVELLYGGEYLMGGSATALRILAITLLVEGLAGPLWTVLFALRISLVRLLGWLLAPVAINLGLNAIVIPRYGFVGASWVSLLSAITIRPLLLYRLRDYIRPLRFGLVWWCKFSAALGGMAFVIWLLRDSALVLEALAGATSYGAAILALGLIPSRLMDRLASRVGRALARAFGRPSEV